MADNDRILLRKDLCKALGVSSETMRRWLRDGKVPKPDIALSMQVQGWRLTTLQSHGIRLV